MTNLPPCLPHVPGPYFYERDSAGCDDIWKILDLTTKKTIAYIDFWDEPDTNVADATEANIRLLAAAPEMFDALTEVVTALNRLDITVEDGALFRAMRSARHALALADGTLSYRAC